VTGRDSSSHLPLGEGAEFDAIRALLAEWGTRARGIGDDAAVIQVPAGEQLVASTDASVEEVHFRREWLTAEEIGARAAAAALSDLAAMAARPLGLLLALAVPARWDDELGALARGVGAVAERAGCAIVGGNVTRARELSLTITVLGTAVAPLRRSGACVGHRVFVTGRLGGPGAALAALLAGRRPDAAARARFVAPVPRIHEARWLAEHGASAAIDVSDGLLADAAHLARASGVSLAIELAALPCMDGVRPEEAAASGEEYELLVTLSPDAELAGFEERFGAPVTAIGVVAAAGAQPVRLVGAPAAAVRGHDHLA
jgi:thiamine-monophosphate kinase